MTIKEEGQKKPQKVIHHLRKPLHFVLRQTIRKQKLLSKNYGYSQYLNLTHRLLLDECQNRNIPNRSSQKFD